MIALLHTKPVIESNRAAVGEEIVMAERQKVALVTGSALNIGRATALALARDGYRVMVTARSSAADCARTAEMIAEAGGEAAVHLADISDAKQARGLVEDGDVIETGAHELDGG